jgi:outer membrane protein assembly factor BamB
MDPLSRRQLLAAGSLALVSTAGCLWRDSDSTGENGSNSTPGEAETGTEQATGTPSETAAEGTVTPTSDQVEHPSEITTTWPFPGYSYGRTANTPETAGPQGGVSELWSVNTGDVLSTPIITGERLFVIGQSGTIRALEATTGTQLWTVSVDPVGRSVGVLGDRLWVRTGQTLVSLDLEGNRLWQVESNDYRRGAIGPQGVYYLERRYGTTLAVGTDHSGEQRWKADLVSQEREEIVAGPEHVYAVSGPEFELHKIAAESGDSETLSVPGGSPKGLTVADGDLFYADRTGNLYAPNWWLDLAVSGVSSPRVGPDTVFVFVRGGDNQGVLAFDRKTGARRWQSPDIEVRDFVATTDSVIACTPERLIALDVADGTERWQTSFPDRRQPNLAVVDDMVYVSHSDGIVVYRES